MTEQKVVLDTAEFLDSEASQALTSVPRKDQKTILERFLSCVYLEGGKAPEHLDGDDVHSILGHLMPGHFQHKDPLAGHVKSVLSAYFDHLEGHAYVPQLPSLRLALEWTAEEFEETVRTGKSEHHGAPPVRPIVNRAPKVGRNEPCPCGSGKKFKKCCARLGS